MGNHKKHVHSGTSSFDFVDKGKLLRALSLKMGIKLADLGCGVGNYSILFSEKIGENGLIYAVDNWKGGIDTLEKKAEDSGISNIKTIHADISNHIPLNDGSVDVCFMATVFHGTVINNEIDKTLSEIKRILKPEGSFVILEFNKVELPIGPPVKEKLSPAEIEEIIIPFGFKKRLSVESGEYHYLVIFDKNN